MGALPHRLASTFRIKIEPDLITGRIASLEWYEPLKISGDANRAWREHVMLKVRREAV